MWGRRSVIAAAIVTGWCCSAWAIITGLTVGPNPTVVGNSIVGTATDDGKDPIATVVWEYRFKSAFYTSFWTTFGNGGLTSPPLAAHPFPGRTLSR